MTKCELDALFERFVESWRRNASDLSDDEFLWEDRAKYDLLERDLLHQATREASRRGLR